MSVSRREFLFTTLAAGGGILVGCSLPALREGGGRSPASAGERKLHGWIHMTPSGQVIFYLDRVELGQGIRTSHVMIVAEELGIEPQKIVVRTAPWQKPPFINIGLFMNATGGSVSTAEAWLPLSNAAAGIRYGLLQAAVARAHRRATVTPDEEFDLRDGYAISHDGKHKFAMGDLLSDFGKQAIPSNSPRRDAKNYRFIGKDMRRLEILQKVTGAPDYGIDVHVPGLLTAVVVRSPKFGGRVPDETAIDKDAVLASPGVKSVFSIGHGVAVVADTFWHAHRASRLLKVAWDNSEALQIDSHKYLQELKHAAQGPAKKMLADNGKVKGGAAVANVDVEYDVPYLAHAAMEPLCCTIYESGGRIVVHAGSQVPPGAIDVVHLELGVDADDIELVQPLIGGSFGRRVHQDFVMEAARIFKVIRQPVKLIWRREDDFRHDFYRPASFHKLNAGVNSSGEITSWRHRIVAPSIFAFSIRDLVQAALPDWVLQNFAKRVGRAVENRLENSDLDPTTAEGARVIPYRTGRRRVELVPVRPALAIGFWRSVGYSANAFVIESFIDELARAAGASDPIAFRLNLLSMEDSSLGREILKYSKDTTHSVVNLPLSVWPSKALAGEDPRRFVAVWEVLKQATNWDNPAPNGWSVGVAQAFCFGSYSAQAVYVSIDQKRRVHVHKVVCAVDCGLVINPDNARAQIEGGIIFALSAALKQKIQFKAGEVQQSNFHQYDCLRMFECPEIEIHFVPTDANPSGVGELGVPALAPALCNAVFAATGVRLRTLPVVL